MDKRKFLPFVFCLWIIFGGYALYVTPSAALTKKKLEFMEIESGRIEKNISGHVFRKNGSSKFGIAQLTIGISPLNGEQNLAEKIKHEMRRNGWSEKDAYLCWDGVYAQVNVISEGKDVQIYFKYDASSTRKC